jgi:hypothetical protein
MFVVAQSISSVLPNACCSSTPASRWGCWPTPSAALFKTQPTNQPPVARLLHVTPPRTPTCGSKKHTPLRHSTRCHVGQSTHPHEAVKTMVKKGNGNLGGKRLSRNRSGANPNVYPASMTVGPASSGTARTPRKSREANQKLSAEKNGYDG